MKKIVFLLLLALSIFAEEVPKNVMQMSMSPINIDGQTFLAANFKNFSHWHTYWINPGDAGLPIEATFKINGEEKNLTVKEWPIPKRFKEDGDIMTFGYEDEYTLFFEYPGDLKDQKIEAHFKWLICKNICIPGEKHINGEVKDSAFITADNDFQVSMDEMKTRFSKLPKEKELPVYFDISLVKQGENLVFIYSISKPVMDIPTKNNVLSIYPMLPFSFKRESLFTDSKKSLYGKYTMDWDGVYMEPEMPLPADGKFEKPFDFKFLLNDPITKETYVIKKSFSSYSFDNNGQFESFFKILKPVIETNEVKSHEDVPAEASTGPNMLYYLVMAFLGGLILNIMPCVLPVISLKLFSLIGHSNESKKSIFRHNLAYSAGVIATFFALAGVITLLKNTGEQIGWGFQLQSPSFVALMIVIIFVMALNMFGLFEFRTPGGSKLGSVELKDTFSGDFIGGVLATILSTPCSAPFLGTALTFAFSESTATIFGIFFAIGLGLSFPFLLTAFFPSLIKFLPKPGMWMNHVKKILGLTLILTTIWLLDVFSALTDSSLAVMKINTGLVLIFFIFYMRAKMTKKIIWSIIFLIPTIVLIYQAQGTVISYGESGSNMLNDKNRDAEITWQKWSEEKMNDNMRINKLTFIDFTAKWCITCKVNERLVIDTKAFRDLVKEKNVELMLGDWTKRDPQIGAWLKSQGFVGVPAYFVINSKGELIKLGETITVAEIKNSL
ncbi:protein-disulfide reductase DsbD [Bacteriovorax sp. Seq25_V]|uniref:protein-disulfide reductase DsbD family protein n=1 Tax=Bacteriovorax sp. Seq25_V TaxID=1201288 RepID=UPI00038A4100|nr:thioredoxin family protein [Bacteriovorax sp. Seq25_V]EQC46653.1 cytochrome C biogenesis protein transmembrane region [Bacteriovorax sp. Seq25_V]